MKFTLPIKDTYVSDWGLWQCLRELVQNAKDEEEQNRNEMSIVWRGGILTLRNEGADMDRKALLIGHSGKTDKGLRGKHGEGLDLALLAGVRQGRKIVIDTKKERWIPSVEHSDEYSANCLTITTRAHTRPRSGVTVTIEITEEEWNQYKERFLFLSEHDANKVVRLEGRGSILLAPEHKGNVYVKGIYVDSLPKLHCGYDLEQMKLDRDRRMIDVWDLQWQLGSMYQNAVSQRPDVLGHKVYELLRNSSEDTKSMQYFTSEDVSSALATQFKAEHGETAFPVSSIAEARTVEYLGHRGIVVSKDLGDALLSKMGTVEDLKGKLSTEIVRSVHWSDMADEHKDMITKWTDAFDKIGKFPPVASKLDIVVYRDPSICGMYDKTTGRITVSSSLLNSPRDFLETIVHEVAHAISGCADFEQGHVDAIEKLWSALYFSQVT